MSPAAQAPRTQEPSSRTTWSREFATTWPFGPRGRSIASSAGFGFTPAVHTSIPNGNDSPSESCATSSSQDFSVVFSRTSMPRFRSSPSVQADSSGPDLGRDAVERLDQHPARLHAAERRLRGDGLLREVGQLRERLDAGVAAADEDEGEVLLPLLRVGGGRRAGDVLEHPVAGADGLLDRLEADAALGETRGREDAADRAHADHDVVVLEALLLAVDRSAPWRRGAGSRGR